MIGRSRRKFIFRFCRISANVRSALFCCKNFGANCAEVFLIVRTNLVFSIRYISEGKSMPRADILSTWEIEYCPHK